MSCLRGIVLAGPNASAGSQHGHRHVQSAASTGVGRRPFRHVILNGEGQAAGRDSWHSRTCCNTRRGRRCPDSALSLPIAFASASAEELAPADEVSIPESKFRDIGKRVGVSLAIGGICGIAVFQGGLVFSLLIAALSYQSSVEYFGLLNATSVAEQRVMHPPRWGVTITTVLCGTIPLLTFWFAGGRLKAALTVMAFGLLVLMLIMQRRPRFSQFTSTVFGLFYCGYLPSFWLKLRMLAIPAGKSSAVFKFLSGAGLSGVAVANSANVGFLATLVSVLTIIAADTGAYVVGKSMGKTQLIAISPKKTVEGATGGMLCALLTAVAGCLLVGWPGSYQSAAVFSVLVFLASLFGDLMESVMKRDAGVKDSGELLPGHGGLLDRFDSYMFTGAMVYFYVKLACPWLGWA